MSGQSIKHKDIEDFIITTDHIYTRMAEKQIIKDHYLPNQEGYCEIKHFHIKNLTRLLRIDECYVKDNLDKIKEVLNTLQLNYKTSNKFK